MPIPNETIEQIRASADIVDIISDYVRLRRTGKNWVGLCPFHEDKSPSLAVEPVRGIYKCFACGKGGNIFTFLMEHNHWTFPETVRYLAGKLRIELPGYGEQERAEYSEYERLLALLREAALYYYQTLRSDAGSLGNAYFQARGFSNETIIKFGLGYAVEEWESLITHLVAKGFTHQEIEQAGLSVKREGKAGWYDRFRGRVIFPVFTIYGKVAGFGARIINDTGEKEQPKYLNSPESTIYQKSKLLYGLYQAKEALRKSQRALIVEGYSDVITLHQAGVGIAVATCGTALTADHAEALARLVKSVVVMFDGDQSGTIASYRGIDILLRQGLDVFILRLPLNEDPDSFVRNHGIEAFQRQVEDSVPFLDYRLHEFHRSGAFDTVERKAGAIRDLIKTIAQMPDAIKRELLAQRLAASLRVSEQEILKVLRSSNPHSYTKPSIPSRTAKRREDYPNAEFLLLSILVQGDTSLFAAVLADIDPDDFTHPTCRQCLELLLERYGEGAPFRVEQMIGTPMSEELRDFLTLLAFPQEAISTKWGELDPETKAPNTRQLARQCVGFFVSQRLNQQRKIIVRDIEELMTKGGIGEEDDVRVTALLKALETNTLELEHVQNMVEEY